ncbi:FGGY carbohydrate kinase domain-containing protein-like isoform X2 [Crassostrea angulata]|uniref:FGGY carbohydrate kinase domain-containing protein-like isoform X2 n=1 Tax=Magallana angulata TaxID=2784310 RepID=UPI0022B115E6|nr:FGGY carbohydrate kinase domain-containing protein-like isoform X2 [Crassostrea angulata]
MTACYIGVDVGTKSVRAAVVNRNGRVVAKATKDIRIWNPDEDFYVQSSENIWEAVIHAVKAVIEKSGVEKDYIHGIGFDATCSLVVLDADGKPVSVSHGSSHEECNIVMWMDHRASEEAIFINSTNHEALKCMGGQMSLEMQPPKLLWLKKNLPDTWNKAGHFFDLPDFLTWKATGDTSRSLCSLVCKWSYQADSLGTREWNQDFYKTIGLEDLLSNNATKIGKNIQSPGAPCGSGLCDSVAMAMGLNAGTPVGTSIVDAHAGVIGSVGCVPKATTEDKPFPLPDLTSRLVLICGTSNCHMIISRNPHFVPGVWGPYYSAILPGLYNAEGGQSAGGKLIDEIIESHPAYIEAMKDAEALSKQRGKPVHIHDYLNDWLNTYKTRDNLPFKCGLTFSVNLKDLATQYLASIQALAYGTRHIIDEMKKAGHSVEIIYMCGGLSKNSLYVETHANVLGLPVVLPLEEESVLVGSAVLGASASKDFSTIQDAMLSMCGEGTVTEPSKSEAEFHDKKYQVFRKMVEDQKQYRAIMNG